MPELHGTKELMLDQVAKNAPTSMQQQTRPQVAIFGGTYKVDSNSIALSSGNNTNIVGLPRDWRTGEYWHWRKVRQMRRHPTVKLVRDLVVSGQAAAKWSITAQDDAPHGAKELLSDVILPLQTHIMGSAYRGMFDFGWQPYEKVFYYDTEVNHIKLKKLKPLLQDQTEIQIDPDNGDWVGFKQHNVFLSKQNALLLNQYVEGTYWYGEGTMPSIEPAYDRWLVTDASNVRFDKKVSGAHWVVHYPPGTSTVSGAAMDNYDLAVSILASLEGSGSVVVPSQVTSFVTDLNSAGSGQLDSWKIEILAAPAAQGEFQARLAYCDVMMVRAGGFPERAILEGQYGTKAEAGEHADFAVANMDYRNKTTEDQLNEGLIEPLLVMNFGQAARRKAKLEIAPVADNTKDFLKILYQSLLSGPSGSIELAKLDSQALRDQLGIPTLARADEDAEPLLEQMLAGLKNQPEESFQNQNPQDPNQQSPNQPQQPNQPQIPQQQ